MASTNKTPGLNLSQYEGSDKFERVDYNADMLKIDETANTLNNGLNSLGNGLSTAHSLAAQANGAAQQSLGTAEYAREQAQSAREFAGQAMSLASNAMTSAAGITVNNIPRTDAYGDIPLTLDNVPDGDTRKLGDAQSIAGVAVDVDGLSVGQTLVYDGDNFVPADGGTGDASSIDGIPVDLGGMTDGQTLVLSDGALVPGSGGSTDDIWLPNVDEDGDISWSRSSSETPPTTRNIKGGYGADGADGQDGITPHIDPTTKHWMIGDTDTGIVAEGKDGDGAGDMRKEIYDPTASGKALAQVYDGLDSTSATLALTAAQGKALADMIGDIGGVLDNINGEVV